MINIVPANFFIKKFMRKFYCYNNVFWIIWSFNMIRFYRIQQIIIQIRIWEVETTNNKKIHKFILKENCKALDIN